MTDYYSDMQAFQFKDPNYFVLPSSSFLQMTGSAVDLEKGPAAWKFHMSVHGDDVVKAWNIAAPIIMQDGPDHVAKVVTPKAAKDFANPENPQAGKMITLYTFDQRTPEEYMALLQKIEKAFRDEGIRPGADVHGDRKVQNSGYAFYRNQEGLSTKYVAASDLENLPADKKYNPAGHHDPYRNFDITAATAKPPLSIMDANWQGGVTGAGTMITRVAVGDRSPAEIEQFTKDLERAGLSPKLQHSDTLGMTVRLSGDDVQKLSDMQKATVSVFAGKWESAQTESSRFITRMSVADKTQEEIKVMVSTLQQKGLNPEVRESASLGMTIRLSDGDVQKFSEMQSKAKPASLKM